MKFVYFDLGIGDSIRMESNGLKMAFFLNPIMVPEVL
jgi:hypothetical protein